MDKIFDLGYFCLGKSEALLLQRADRKPDCKPGMTMSKSYSDFALLKKLKISVEVLMNLVLNLRI